MKELDDLRVRDAVISPTSALDISRFPSHVSTETRNECCDALRLVMAQYSHVK